MKYDVIKYVTAIEDNKTGDIIFKDINDRIYFLDKRYNKGIEKIKLGDKVLVWVQKEMKKVGYVALEINGCNIKSYIKNFDKLTLDDILTLEPKVATNKTRLHNDMYNHDIDFSTTTTDAADVPLLSFAKEVIDFYDSKGINSEVAEFKYELAQVLSYLYYKFCMDDMILNSHKLISEICECYPPNIIEISDDGLYVNYYHGLEEGLMCWDRISIVKLKNEILKRI